MTNNFIIYIVINILLYLFISIPLSKFNSSNLDWRKNSSLSFKYFGVKNFFIQIFTIILFGFLISLFDILFLINKNPKG